MGEKEGKKKDGKDKKADDGAKDKKETAGGGDGVITVVLKVDMHCEGCAKKVKRSVKGFEGVETVTIDIDNHKLTVVGKVDPWKLRKRVEVKTHKKVTLVSPTDLPKKVLKEDERVDVKPIEPVASTAAFKMRLHCEGCIQRIRRSIYKVKGVEEVMIDPLNDLVTVKGTMDVQKMVPYLADKFKRTIEIIPSKKDDGGDKKNKDKETEKKKEKKEEGKEKEKEEEASAEKKGGGNGEEKKKEGGGEKKKEDGGGGDEKKEDGGGGDKKKEDGGGGDKKIEDDGGKKEGGSGEAAPKVEMNKMDYYGGGAAPAGYVACGYNYPIEIVHAPQYFSDENPNACSVM